MYSSLVPKVRLHAADGTGRVVKDTHGTTNAPTNGQAHACVCTTQGGVGCAQGSGAGQRRALTRVRTRFNIVRRSSRAKKRMKMQMNGNKGCRAYKGRSFLVDSAFKTIRKADTVRGAAVDLVTSMGYTAIAEDLSTWGDDELRGLSVPLAESLGLPKGKAVRLVAKLRHTTMIGGSSDTDNMDAKGGDEAPHQVATTSVVSAEVLRTMSFQQLRQLAKQHGVKASGKAEELRTRLQAQLTTDEQL